MQKLFFLLLGSTLGLRESAGPPALAPAAEDTVSVMDCDGFEYSLPLAGSDAAVTEQMRSNALLLTDTSGFQQAMDVFVQAKIAKLKGVIRDLQSLATDADWLASLRAAGRLNMCDDPTDPDVVNSQNVGALFGFNRPVFADGVLEDQARGEGSSFLGKKVRRHPPHRLFHSDQAEVTVKDILPGQEHNLHLYQGDMLYTKAESGMREKSVSSTSDSVRWRNWDLWSQATVNWYVDPAAPVDACATATFQTAASLVEKYTCVRFVQGSAPSASNNLKLTSDGSTCWAYVGMSAQSQVNLGGSGCQIPGIALHEIGHALGLIHQQSREDRDTFVTIGWGNVLESAKNNFLKIYSDSAFDTVVSKLPYDYTSVMHYSSCEFSKARSDSPCGQTITAASASMASEMGQRDHLSDLDIQTINSMYACSATCGDGIQNQGEVGIDCGGPCKRVCGDASSDGVVPLPAECAVDNGRPLLTTEWIIIIAVIGSLVVGLVVVYVMRARARTARKDEAKARLVSPAPAIQRDDVEPIRGVVTGRH